MIPYMVGKLAPNPTHSTRGLVKYVSGRGYFRAVLSKNGDKIVISPPPSLVERVEGQQGERRTGNILGAVFRDAKDFGRLDAGSGPSFTGP